MEKSWDLSLKKNPVQRMIHYKTVCQHYTTLLDISSEILGRLHDKQEELHHVIIAENSWEMMSIKGLYFACFKGVAQDKLAVSLTTETSLKTLQEDSEVVFQTFKNFSTLTPLTLFWSIYGTDGGGPYLSLLVGLLFMILLLYLFFIIEAVDYCLSSIK